VQIGITLVGILTGAFGGSTLAHEISVAVGRNTLLAPHSEAIGLAVVVVTITILSLIVGELVPKRLALNSPERIASRIAGPMTILAVVSGPVVWFLAIATDRILRLLRVDASREAAITEQEIRVLIAEGTEAGVFGSD
jgi:magnesium and cobalt exporter, CNNM family